MSQSFILIPISMFIVLLLVYIIILHKRQPIAPPPTIVTVPSVQYPPAFYRPFHRPYFTSDYGYDRTHRPYSFQSHKQIKH